MEPLPSSLVKGRSRTSSYSPDLLPAIGKCYIKIDTKYLAIFALTRRLLPHNAGRGYALRLTVQHYVAIAFDICIHGLNNPTWRHCGRIRDITKV